MALEDFLLDKALGEARLTYANGHEYAGDEMVAELAWLRQAAANIRSLAVSMPTQYVEQAAIAGALTPDVGRALSVSQTLAGRLNDISAPSERTWIVTRR